jgi:hypothetical protein
LREEFTVFMSHASPLPQFRRPALSGWLGAWLAVLLILAGTFAVTHAYDSAAHTNGQSCAECLSTASFSAAAAATPLTFHLPLPAPLFFAVVVAVFVSAAPVHRYARGPPVVSFSL